MSLPASIAVCLLAGAALLVLDWILRLSDRPGEQEPDGDVPDGDERGTGRSGDGLGAAGLEAAPGAMPAHTDASPRSAPSGPDWFAALDASPALAEDPSLFARSLLEAARAQCDLSAAALWIERGPAASRTSGDDPQPLRVAIELLEADRGGPDTLHDLFRPWAHALEAGETVCIPDAASEPDLCGRLRLRAANLVLAPFRSPAGELGVLALAWNEPCRAGGEEVTAARRLAERAGAAIERRLQRGEMRRLHAQGQALVRVAAALRHAGDLDVALRVLLEAVRDGLGLKNAAILLVDDASQELYVACQVGYGEAVASLRLDLAGRSVTATAAREGRIVVVPDVEAWPGYVSGDEGIRSEIALPLLAEGELLGVLDVESADRDAFQDASRDVLEAAADEAALVLSHARLLTGLRQRAEQLQAADRLARAITGSIDPTAILESVVAEVRQAIAADVTLVLRPEASSRSWMPAAAAWGDGPASPARLAADSDAGRQAAAAATGGFLADTAEDDSAFALWCRQAGWRSVYWIPVVLDDEPVGLFLACMRHERGFPAARRAMLEALAPHVAAAIRNAQLYEQLELSYRRLGEAQEQNLRNEQFRILGEMTSGLAHKFNNVLGVIIGRVQTALERTTDSALQRDLRIVERAAHEGAITIRQLQQFTGTRGERTARPVNLAEIGRRVAERAVRNWRPDDAVAPETHRLVLDGGEAAWVLGIREDLEEVVQHLVDNAVDAMPKGGVLGLRVWRRGEAWTLEVSDTGPGIGEETRNRMFHPFVTTKGPRNLGLGLSIAYAIVTRHEGRIEASSEAQRGTTLCITLPACEAPAVPESAQEGTASRVARVLVVDDEPALADVLGEMLVAGGYETVVAASPAEAVERLAAEPFDVVLSDLGMPGLTGWDLALHCRHLHPGLPVVLITGWGLEVDDQRIAESGVFEVIPKPFEMQAVLEVVARAVAREERRAA